MGGVVVICVTIDAKLVRVGLKTKCSLLAVAVMGMMVVGGALWKSVVLRIGQKLLNLH